MIKVDPIAMANKIPFESMRLTALTQFLNIGIPFNTGLGMKITKLTPEEVQIQSPPKRKRENHVGSSHACFLALLSEYPAGVLIAQKYSFEKYRIIISQLNIEYFKQGRGTLTSTVKGPQIWPELVNGEMFIDMQTEITNEKSERISLCKTKWQIKEWSQVKNSKKPSTNSP
jgi:acyl-coenzyme A thioesterase PaaI-like protein